MKLSPYLSTSLAAGAFLLAGSFALAQTTSATRNMHPRNAAGGQSAGMAVDHQGGNGVRRMAGVNAGSESSSAASTDAKSMGSAHATESLGINKSSGSSQANQDNASGVNPLYESKDKANPKPGAGSSAVQYKDPEDMTTRYRPGNNKTTRSANDASAQGAGAVQPQAMSKKHIAGVKYEDRIAGDNPGGTNAQGGTAGQSAQDSARRKSGSIIAVDREGASQRKDGSIVHSDFPRSADRNSAHATESLSPSSGGGNGARGMAVNEQGSRGPAQIYKRH